MALNKMYYKGFYCMENKSIAIIGLHDLYRMQYLYKYTQILDEYKIDYDVIYWNRKPNIKIKAKEFNGKKYEYRFYLDNSTAKIKKIIPYIKCLCFTWKILNSNNYKKYILLTTQTAVPLFLMLLLCLSKKKYIYDYRDITFENYKLWKFVVRWIIDNSYFTSISSLGFKSILGDSPKYIMSHNINTKIYQIQSKGVRNNNKIVLSYWGGIRQINYIKRLCKFFANDTRLIIHFYGEGPVGELEDYCKENYIDNIFFFGRYTTDEIENFARNTDILLNLYENDRKQELALTVKLYDAIKYNLPMLVTSNSYMDKIFKDNCAVMSIDVEKNNCNEIVNWYRNLKSNISYYEIEREIIKNDENIFKEKLLKFIKL